MPVRKGPRSSGDGGKGAHADARLSRPAWDPAVHPGADSVRTLQRTVGPREGGTPAGPAGLASGRREEPLRPRALPSRAALPLPSLWSGRRHRQHRLPPGVSGARSPLCEGRTSGRHSPRGLGQPPRQRGHRPGRVHGERPAAQMCPGQESERPSEPRLPAGAGDFRKPALGRCRRGGCAGLQSRGRPGPGLLEGGAQTPTTGFLETHTRDPPAAREAGSSERGEGGVCREGSEGAGAEPNAGGRGPGPGGGRCGLGAVTSGSPADSGREVGAG